MLINKISELKEKINIWKKEGQTIGLVPTMGALHDGHLSLIKKAIKTCDKVIVSVFVNPIQFCPGEDYDKYPRQIEADVKVATGAGAAVIFAPTSDEMYGNGQILSNNTLAYIVPPFFYTDKLCGKSRPGHFDGVCTVVGKLFNITQADYAFFGQKDAQQLIIIKKFVKDLNFNIKIVECPIIREKNGLALSSRNKYLTENGKEEALVLSKILQNIKLCYGKGITNVEVLKETAFSFLNSNHELEYLEFVDKETLDDKTVADSNTLVLIACRVENVRLIDNILL